MMRTKMTASSGDKPKQIQIMRRDLYILQILASGPVIAARLLTDLTKYDGMKATTIAALFVRLSALVRAGYITSWRYQSRNGQGRHALYGLTEQGIALLTTNRYPRDHIRCNVPSDFTVTHELMVVDAVRTLIRESSEGLYELSVRDENTIKEMMKLKAYPDLLIKIEYYNNDKHITRAIFIEIDNDTHLPHRVVQKVKLLRKLLILFLCTTTERCDKLINAFAQTNDSELCGRVVFGLACDFSQHGLKNSSFLDANLVPVTLLPRNVCSRNN